MIERGLTLSAVQPLSSILAAVAASCLLLLLALPVGALIGGSGARGLSLLVTDHELRTALLLTIGTATSATLLAALGGTSIAWLLTRKSFRGRALRAALLNLPAGVATSRRGNCAVVGIWPKQCRGTGALANGPAQCWHAAGHHLRDGVCQRPIVCERGA